MCPCPQTGETDRLDPLMWLSRIISRNENPSWPKKLVQKLFFYFHCCWRAISRVRNHFLQCLRLQYAGQDIVSPNGFCNVEHNSKFWTSTEACFLLGWCQIFQHAFPSRYALSYPDIFKRSSRWNNRTRALEPCSMRSCLQQRPLSNLNMRIRVPNLWCWIFPSWRRKRLASSPETLSKLLKVFIKLNLKVIPFQMLLQLY